MNRLSAAGTAGLILRTAVGSVIFAHGRNHQKNLAGTARWFKTIGFREETTQARRSAYAEMGAGLALIVGAGTPVASAGVIAAMVVAIRAVHTRHGFFIARQGWEYNAALVAAAAALAATGPGPVSVDRLVGVDDPLSPVARSLGALVLGSAAGLGLLRIFWQDPDNAIAAPSTPGDDDAATMDS